MKAIIYEFNENTDLRFIKRKIKKMLDEYGVESRIKSFEDSEQLRLRLLDEANYTRARDIVSERIKDKRLYGDSESLRAFLTDTAVFYLLRLNEDAENGNVIKAVDKALKDVKIQLSSCSSKGDNHETWNKNNKHDWIPIYKQVAI